jgi:4-hydroxy-3-methylbut-2-enyl diphosphate reductase
MRKFDIPDRYRSKLISQIKQLRKIGDPMKKDYTPTVLDFGNIIIYLARHFGFCFGVENAIEKAYSIIEGNPGKKIYLLSEMIHNPLVNEDLKKRGLCFIFNEKGKQEISWDKITKDDIVIIPAFGVSLETREILSQKGIDTRNYNTTCPFVEKVWNKSAELGKKDYTIIIHGKHNHEETIATFSHAKQSSPSIIVRNFQEAKILGKIIMGEIPTDNFFEIFKDKYSPGFNPIKDLEKIGVVNQTTMLASETQKISEYFKSVMIRKYGRQNIHLHYADTRDTLCYATNDNQRATVALAKTDADLGIVVGGYNSSNTTHLVEILESKFPTYFISDEEKLLSKRDILHFNFHKKVSVLTRDFLPKKREVKIALTSGASCPDRTVENVLRKLLSFFMGKEDIKGAMAEILINLKSANN